MHTRKFLTLTVIACSLFLTNARAQKLKNFLDNSDSSFTWLGVDFTQARLIGDAGANTADAVDRHFAGINQVVVNEPKKYDVPGNLHHEKVTYDISLVNKRNAAINKDNIKTDNVSDGSRLKPEDISTLVKGFDFGGKSGIGALVVMEGLNKTANEASMYITLIDMDRRRVLLTERYTGKAKGFGFRNYWAYSVYKALEDFDDDYKKLKEKYADAKDPVEETPKKEGKTAIAQDGAKAAKKPKKKS
ncbi:hypothetical protein [Chitinophaga solisilvae]|uniref:Uncharacterized protein n=1 Tax=Chitinophaga solisilvae TaxID=1233460 RepID=A0A3S1AXS7_9BACT|nr:hypothetical protein [Chitinophaga solisilvae]NSL90448.1 hypothetical protein [Chitinophaga solisilvae]